MDLKTRLKFPQFRVLFFMAVLSPAFSGFNITVEDLTTWGIIIDLIKHTLSNPYTIYLMVLGGWSVIYDPTSEGWLDG